MANRYMYIKRFSALMLIREMYIKITMWYQPAVIVIAEITNKNFEMENSK